MTNNMPVSNKDKYRQLCEEKFIPFFMQAWWMDAVCGVDKWEVLLSEKEGVIIGALPYLLVRKSIFKCIIQPQLTQYNGVWIDYPKGIKLAKKCSLEKEIMSNLIDQIKQKRIHYFNQNFYYSINNCDPFVSKGFTQSIRYTYVIEDISHPDKVYKPFSYAKQKHIKKSEGKLNVKFDISADAFYDFHAEALSQRDEKIVYSKALFMSIYKSSVERNQGQIISIADNQGNIHAALFVVWDKQSAYYLISAIDTNFKSSGASTLMIWEAIKFLSDKTQIFDFEGSMIESVAKSFKEFGSVRKSYVNISNYYSPIFKLIMQLRKV